GRSRPDGDQRVPSPAMSPLQGRRWRGKRTGSNQAEWTSGLHPMLTFLFWNMGGELPAKTSPRLVVARKAPLLDVVGNLVRRHDVDLLLVSECPLGQGDVLRRINHGSPVPYCQLGFSLCDRVTIYSRFPKRCMSLQGASESSRYTCRHVR